MTPEEIAKQFYEKILVDNLKYYRNGYLSNYISKKHGDLAIDSVMANLSDHDRNIIEKLIGIVIVDTISSVFGILDNISYFSSERKDFLLSYDGVKLTGDLQALFLSEVEERDPTYFEP